MNNVRRTRFGRHFCPGCHQKRMLAYGEWLEDIDANVVEDIFQTDEVDMVMLNGRLYDAAMPKEKAIYIVGLRARLNS